MILEDWSNLELYASSLQRRLNLYKLKHLHLNHNSNHPQILQDIFSSNFRIAPFQDTRVRLAVAAAEAKPFKLEGRLSGLTMYSFDWMLLLLLLLL